MPIQDELTQDAGPLPVWAWAGLGTIGLAAYLAHRKKKQMNAASAQQNNQASVQSNLGSVPISNLSVGASPMPFQMGDTFVNVPAPTINQSQSTSPTTVNVAAPTTTPTPPSPAPPPTPSNPIATPTPPAQNLPPAPVPKPPAAPAPQKTVTVCSWPNWCGSLWGIAGKVYGDPTQWPKIYQANKGLIGSNPNLIHPGQVLVIP